jgi:glycerol-3-phosphate dehydrogenase (NAD(P)+)
MNRRAAVLGAGEWGTAIALLLARRGAAVSLWARRAEHAAAIAHARENAPYLPGVALPEGVTPTADLPRAVHAAGLIVLAIPSQSLPACLVPLAALVGREATLVSATKGILSDSLETMVQVIRRVVGAPPDRVATLSGPSFAQEVADGLPTAIVAASEEAGTAQAVQAALGGPAFRVYASTDPLGVELGGALKNVFAIAAGIVDGLGLGHNARAALITRGLAEMARLGVAMGARPETLAGLAGTGDLILTCTSDLSRNRRLGMELAKGARLEEILAGGRFTAEGVWTARAAVRLAARYGIEMPIAQEVADVLFARRSPRRAAEALMARALKFE